jgi:hypothetical protein
MEQKKAIVTGDVLKEKARQLWSALLQLLKLWKLQKGNSQDLQALDRLEREIVRYKSSIATQTTIHRFFRPVP